MTEQFKKQITAKAREFASTYTNRHLPNEPAFAFGNEGWAAFVDALAVLSHPKSNLADSGVIADLVVFATVLDPRDLRVFLQSLQAGEMSVSRAVEILDMWLVGKYSDDQVPPPPADSALIVDDKFPMELVRELRAELADLRAAAPVVPAPEARDEWRELFWSVARALNCLPSTYVDGNAHVYKQAEKYAAIATAAPVAQLSEPPASAALMRILKIVQDYVPPDGTPIEEAMSQIIACVDPWPDTGFNQFDDLLDDAAEWSGYVEVDTAPYGLKRHLKEVFEKYGITAAAPTTPKELT